MGQLCKETHIPVYLLFAKAASQMVQGTSQIASYYLYWALLLTRVIWSLVKASALHREQGAIWDAYMVSLACRWGAVAFRFLPGSIESVCWAGAQSTAAQPGPALAICVILPTVTFYSRLVPQQTPSPSFPPSFVPSSPPFSSFPSIGITYCYQDGMGTSLSYLIITCPLCTVPAPLLAASTETKEVL